MHDRRPNENKNLSGLYFAWLASLAGFRYIYRHEEAFRLELTLTVLAPLAAVFISGSALGALIVFSACILVMVVEALNTAVEVLVDRISLEPYPLSGAAKDIGSLAVLLATIHAGVWWISAAFFL